MIVFRDKHGVELRPGDRFKLGSGSTMKVLGHLESGHMRVAPIGWPGVSYDYTQTDLSQLEAERLNIRARMEALRIAPETDIDEAVHQLMDRLEPS